MHDNSPNNDLIAELRVEQIVHGAIIKALVHVFDEQHPELRLRDKLQEVYAETLLHFEVTDMPNLADALERRFASFGIRRPKPIAHKSGE